MFQMRIEACPFHAHLESCQLKICLKFHGMASERYILELLERQAVINQLLVRNKANLTGTVESVMIAIVWFVLLT